MSRTVVFFLGGYFYYSISSSQQVTASISQSGLTIAKRIFPWNMLKGYVLEVDRNTQLIKNIVFLFPSYHIIHSFDDDKEKIKSFILALNDYLPMVGEYDQTVLQKFVRMVKL